MDDGADVLNVPTADVYRSRYTLACMPAFIPRMMTLQIGNVSGRDPKSLIDVGIRLSQRSESSVHVTKTSLELLNYELFYRDPSPSTGRKIIQYSVNTCAYGAPSLPCPAFCAVAVFL